MSKEVKMRYGYARVSSQKQNFVKDFRGKLLTAVAHSPEKKTAPQSVPRRTGSSGTAGLSPPTYTPGTLFTPWTRSGGAPCRRFSARGSAGIWRPVRLTIRPIILPCGMEDKDDIFA